MGCDSDSANHFSALLKQNYRTIASDKSPEQMLEGVKATVSADPILSKSCQI